MQFLLLPHVDIPAYNHFKVTNSPEKIILQREKEHCAIFILTRFIVGLRLRLGLSWGVRVRVGVRIR